MTIFPFRDLTLSATNLQDFSNFLLTRKDSKKKPILVLPTTMNEVVWAWYSSVFRQKLRQFEYLVTDGMPLVWLARFYDKQAGRVYGPDLMLRVLDSGQHFGSTHYLYGTNRETLKKLKTNILERFHKVKIVGVYAPPYRPLSHNEIDKVVQHINHSQPDFIWVSLGGSKQVEWSVELKNRLHARAIIPVGAAFDFIAGEKLQAPSWLQRLGLEWLFRLLTEPGRLWKRYVLQIPVFLVLWVLELIKVISKENRKK